MALELTHRLAQRPASGVGIGGQIGAGLDRGAQLLDQVAVVLGRGFQLAALQALGVAVALAHQPRTHGHHNGRQNKRDSIHTPGPHAA